MSESRAIELSNVGKSYRNQRALRAVSLSVAAGECVAIVGANGAGKTTLLRCLLDFTRPDEGTISIAGRSHLDPKSRAVLSFLPERFMPPSYLKGDESLRLLAELHGACVDTTALRNTLARFEFPLEALSRPVRTYSKGMTQKLGLASIIVGRKPWIVLDEPMSGLDPQARHGVAQVIQEARQAGQGVLFTTHSLHDLESLCDRMLVLHNGSPIFLGTPEALKVRHGCTDLEHAFLDEVAQSGKRSLQ